MNEPALKPTGKGRHGRRTTPDIRHSEATKLAAFEAWKSGERAWTYASRTGLKFPTVYGWWAKWRNELAMSINEDCVCAETSTRNCAVHGGPSEADPGDEHKGERC